MLADVFPKIIVLEVVDGCLSSLLLRPAVRDWSKESRSYQGHQVVKIFLSCED